MAIMIPKLTDDRTLAQIHDQLMIDINMCYDMIDPDDEDQNRQAELRGELEDMCLQIGTLDECMALKWAVDCDCFYR